MIAEWWQQAEAHKVLPLDDRFAPRFADNAKRFHGPRKRFVFHAGMGHVPTDVAPDVRSRTYTIEADARIDGPATEGVLIAHGDMTCGYSLYIKDGRLTYDMNVGGQHHIAVVGPAGAGRQPHGSACACGASDGRNIATLLIDGEPAGGFDEPASASSASSPGRASISAATAAARCRTTRRRSAFTGKLRKVTVTDGRRPGARRRKPRPTPRWRANDDSPRSAAWRGQPLCLAPGLRVDASASRWAAGRSTCPWSG